MLAKTPYRQIRPLLLVAAFAVSCSNANTSIAQDDWRTAYSVGQEVQFSISERPSDMQKCIITENDPDSVMRVRCEPFKHWSGGIYIVYGKSNLQGGAAAATWPRASQPAAPPATRRPNGAPAVGALKVGEYACYGTGGRIMIGLGFRVLPGGRYSDLEGGNPGRVSIAGGRVTFSGGHLGGRVGRMLGQNNFAIGAQAECEPY